MQTLNENATNEDWNKFTAFKYHLCRVVEIAKWGVGEAHCSYCQDCKKQVCLERYPTTSHIHISTLDKHEWHSKSL